ncbi:hypothetical protein ACWCOV_13295 [Kribbella sp. NPDC002412]
MLVVQVAGREPGHLADPLAELVHGVVQGAGDTLDVVLPVQEHTTIHGV